MALIVAGFGLHLVDVEPFGSSLLKRKQSTVTLQLAKFELIAINSCPKPRNPF